jgi:hypothetical protein
VVSYFKTFSRFMDAPMIGTLVRTSAFLLHNKDSKELPGKTDVLSAFRQAGRELALQGRISSKTSKKAMQRVIEIPAIARLLMNIRPLRARLIAQGLKTGAIHFK